MTIVEELMPGILRLEVDAALTWFNAREGLEFEVTGIIDPDVSLSTKAAGEQSQTPRLVLSDGDRYQQFRVTANNDSYDIASLDDTATEEGADLPAAPEPAAGSALRLARSHRQPKARVPQAAIDRPRLDARASEGLSPAGLADAQCVGAHVVPVRGVPNRMSIGGAAARLAPGHVWYDEFQPVRST